MTIPVKNQYILFQEKSCVRITQDEYKARWENETLEERAALYFQSFAISAGKLARSVPKMQAAKWLNQNPEQKAGLDALLWKHTKTPQSLRFLPARVQNYFRAFHAAYDRTQQMAIYLYCLSCYFPKKPKRLMNAVFNNHKYKDKLLWPRDIKNFEQNFPGDYQKQDIPVIKQYIEDLRHYKTALLSKKQKPKATPAIILGMPPIPHEGAPPVIGALPRKRKHADDMDPQLFDLNSPAAPITSPFDHLDLFGSTFHMGDET